MDPHETIYCKSAYFRLRETKALKVRDLSDIFKKIKSIEASDEDALSAIGATPEPEDIKEGNNANERSPIRSIEDTTSEAHKPLNLTIPLEDDMIETQVGEIDNKEKTKIEANKERQKKPLSISPVLPSKPQDNQPSSFKETLKRIDKQDEEPKKKKKSKKPKFAQSKSTAQDDAMPDFVTRSTKQYPRFDQPSFDSPKIFLIGSILAILWAISVITLLYLNRGNFFTTLDPFTWLSIALLVIIPAICFIFGGVALKQIHQLSTHSMRLADAADAMSSPDETVIARSTIMAKSIQAQIEDVNLKMSSAVNRMEMLDDMVKSQGSALARSTLAAEGTTTHIDETLTKQSTALEGIATIFEDRMRTLSTMLDAHSENLSNSTQQAEQKIHEARISIEAAAEKVGTTSETVRSNAVQAADTLASSHTEMAMIGNAVKQRAEEMDGIYKNHLTELSTLINQLQDEQEQMSVILEDRLAKMRDMALSASVGAEKLSDASSKGRETVEALANAARITDTAVRARFAEMEDMVKYSTARAESISDTAARQVQNSLSQTRKDISRIEADMMDLMDKLNVAASKSVSSNQPLSFSNTEKTSVEQKELSNRLKFRPLESEDETSDHDIDYHVDVSSKVDAETLGRLDTLPPPPVEIDRDDNVLQTLSFEPIEKDDLLQLKDTIANEDPDMVRTTPIYETEDKGKPWWKWGGLFGEPEPNKNINKSIPSHHRVNKAKVLAELAVINLSPSAIVNDGCIIDATQYFKDNRQAELHLLIRERLGEPVRHLESAMQNDSNLSSLIQKFNFEMAQSFKSYGDDMTLIKNELETDLGRAFLLCRGVLS